jgi:hypothetical protein
MIILIESSEQTNKSQFIKKVGLLATILASNI